MCAPHYASFKCGFQEGVFHDTSDDDQKGVTKVTNFKMYILHFYGVLSDTSNAMYQRHAFHVGDIAILNAKSALVSE
jgi:hypothetical protein